MIWKWYRPLMVTVGASLLLLSLAGVAFLQGGPEGGGEEVLGDPAQFDAAALPTRAAAPGGQLVLSQPPATLNYQGFLSEEGGVPVSGTFSMVASLYDDAGAQRWGPETHHEVVVDRGLFHLVLGSSAPLAPELFSHALLLQLRVGDTTLPRQPLRPTAYAFSLLPGAVIDGASPSGQYALAVTNRDETPKSSGVYASGRNYGLYAAEWGGGDEAIYSEGLVNAAGYRSRADSYLFFPASTGHPSEFSKELLEVLPFKNGGVALRNTLDPAQTRDFYIPLPVPAVIFGQNVTVEQLTITYRTSTMRSYIKATTLRQGTETDDHNILLNDLNPRRSTISRSYSVTPENSRLTSELGYLNLRLEMFFYDTTETIEILGVRVRLGHEFP